MKTEGMTTFGEHQYLGPKDARLERSIRKYDWLPEPDEGDSSSPQGVRAKKLLDSAYRKRLAADDLPDIAQVEAATTSRQKEKLKALWLHGLRRRMDQRMIELLIQRHNTRVVGGDTEPVLMEIDLLHKQMRDWDPEEVYRNALEQHQATSENGLSPLGYHGPRDDELDAKLKWVGWASPVRSSDSKHVRRQKKEEERLREYLLNSGGQLPQAKEVAAIASEDPEAAEQLMRIWFQGRVRQLKHKLAKLYIQEHEQQTLGRDVSVTQRRIADLTSRLVNLGTNQTREKQAFAQQGLG